ncbi:MAG TPA: hypothetical protein VM692_12045 [Gammaproteobacteria bacterium]|nr:hypothetical protein [Gammaproteobacteria bacterium]
MLRRLLINALAASVLSGAAATADAAMHATQEFESGTTRPRTIAFLPPQAMLIKKKVVQTEQQIEESGELANYLGASVLAAFKEQGYDVRVLTPNDVSADPELQELVLDASRRYNEMLTQLRLRLPRQIGKRRYEAGDEMRALAAKLGVDAVGFAEIQIYAAAAGASAVSILTGFGSSGSTTLISVSVIDGATANIEAFFVPPVMRRGSIAGYDAIMENPAARIGELTEATLRDLPKVDAAARSASESDEDVLSDVEGLLEK